jgi:hypothetical protein
MRSSLNYLIALLAAVAFGCQSSSSPSTSSHASHEGEVCEMPGEGTATAAAPTSKPAAPVVPVAKFGAEPKLSDADVVPAASVLAAPESYDGKYVRLKGVVSSVCVKKGCWLRVTPEGGTKASNVFVKFKDPPEGRLIPMAAVGHEVTVEGTVKNATISQAAARHFLQDAGVSQDDIEKVVGPQKQLMVAGPSVQIEGVAQDAE